jgi:hypothetical protein
MKALLFAVLVCLSAWAQTPPPGVSSLPNGPTAAPPLPDLPGDAVIAVFDDGSQFTMGDFKAIVGALPDANRRMALISPQYFVQWWAGMRKLAQMAEKDKLDLPAPPRSSLPTTAS